MENKQLTFVRKIHESDRNITNLIKIDDKLYIEKKSIANEKFLFNNPSFEHIAISFFKQNRNVIVPNVYDYSQEKSSIILEYIDNLRPINIEKDELDYELIFIKIASYFNQQSLIDMSTFLQDNDSFQYLANNKKKHILWYKYIEKLLYSFFLNNDKYSSDFKNTILNNYKLALSSFTSCSSNLIHGDFCRSNLLFKKDTSSLVLLDFEFTTLANNEFDIARYFSFYLLQYLEDSRINNGDSILKRNFLFYTKIFFSNIIKIDIDLFYNFLSFNLLKYLFDHLNTFTKIQSKIEYIDYFIRFVYQLISLKEIDNDLKLFLDVINDSLKNK